MRRIVCLVYPGASSEAELLHGPGSLRIIASQQYLLLKQHARRDEVVLYSKDIIPRVSDVLLVMNCLPLVDVATFAGFSHIVYFFDDMNWSKTALPTYGDKLPFLSGIFHPVESMATELARRLGIQSVFMPWSLAEVAQTAPPKAAAPSFFIDIDPREPCRDSLPRAIAFIRSIQGNGWAVTIPAPFVDQMPADIRPLVVGSPHLPHEQFLQLLAGHWFYVSGIAGSYEFPALEASFMGCGLISLDNALNDAHRGGEYFLNVNSGSDFQSELRAAIAAFDAAAIVAHAHRRYPQDYPARIPAVLDEWFPKAP